MLLLRLRGLMKAKCLGYKVFVGKMEVASCCSVWFRALDLQSCPVLQELNAQTATCAFPGNEEIPSSAVHACELRKRLGKSSHTTAVHTSPHITLQLLLAGSEREGRREDRRVPSCSEGNEVLCGAKGGFQKTTGQAAGWHWALSTPAARGNEWVRRRQLAESRGSAGNTNTTKTTVNHYSPAALLTAAAFHAGPSP